ncbi:MAG TPA: hypothetical protein DER23_09010 [Clostridiales bacterium]|jgi:hypothetical protein|nr:hypothetical protein [Clostridiales bacterium]
MKATFKSIVCFCLLAGVVLGCTALFGFGLELGISFTVTPEKELYDAGDTVRFFTKIVNNTLKDFDNLSLVYYLPSQVSPGNGFIPNVTIPSLSVGSTYTESVSAGIMDPDGMSGWLWILWVILGLVVVVAAVAGYPVWKKKFAPVRTLSLLLVCMMLISFFPQTANADFVAPSKQAVSAESVMRKLGVIPKEVGEAEAIRKRTLAKCLYLLITGKEDAAVYSSMYYFTDVPESHEYAGYINFVCRMGIMDWKKDEEGNKFFEPAERVSNQDISRYFMRLLCGGNARGSLLDSTIDDLVRSHGLSTGFAKLDSYATPASLGTLLVNLLTIAPAAVIREDAWVNVTKENKPFASYCFSFACAQGVITEEENAEWSGVNTLSLLKAGTPVYILSSSGYSFAVARPGLLAVCASTLQYGKTQSLPLYAALYENAAALPYCGDKVTKLKSIKDGDEKKEETGGKDDPIPGDILLEDTIATIVVNADVAGITVTNGDTVLSLIYHSDYDGYRPMPGEVIVVHYIEQEIQSIQVPADIVGWIARGSNNTVTVDIDPRQFTFLNLVKNGGGDDGLYPTSALLSAIDKNNGTLYAALFVLEDVVVAWLPADTAESPMLVTVVNRDAVTGSLSYICNGQSCPLGESDLSLDPNETSVPVVLTMAGAVVTSVDRLQAVTGAATLGENGSISVGQITFTFQDIITGLLVENVQNMSSTEALVTLLRSSSPVNATLYYRDDGGDITLFAFSK